MKYEDIETFLAIIETGTIAKAAEKLYISQGTASTRIQQLEEELGIQLFIRQKGIRHIRLTPAGEALIPIARQTLSLYQEALELKRRTFKQELSIGATDYLNQFVFNDLYQQLIHHESMILNIKTQHSSEIHQLIDHQLCDIGFCTNRYEYSNIIYKELFEESMVLLMHKDHPYNLHQDIQLLDHDYEIYLPISEEYALWHDQYFNHSHYMISVGTIAMIKLFMHDKACWGVLPESSAYDFIKDHPNYCIQLIEGAPKRTIYQLTYKYPRNSIVPIIQEFNQYLSLYLSKLAIINKID